MTDTTGAVVTVAESLAKSAAKPAAYMVAGAVLLVGGKHLYTTIQARRAAKNLDTISE